MRAASKWSQCLCFDPRIFFLPFLCFSPSFYCKWRSEQPCGCLAAGWDQPTRVRQPSGYQDPCKWASYQSYQIKDFCLLCTILVISRCSRINVTLCLYLDIFYLNAALTIESPRKVSSFLLEENGLKHRLTWNMRIKWKRIQVGGRNKVQAAVNIAIKSSKASEKTNSTRWEILL